MIDHFLGRGTIFIYFSFLAAFILQIFPLFEWLNYLRPLWVLMLLLYWVQVAPSKLGIVSAFVIGLLMDVLRDDLLGMHALTLSVLSYLMFMFHRRLRVFSTVQQVLVVFLFSVFYLLLLRILQAFFSEPVAVNFGYWFPALTSALVWPWFYLVMNEIKARFNIYEVSS